MALQSMGREPRHETKMIFKHQADDGKGRFAGANLTISQHRGDSCSQRSSATAACNQLSSLRCPKSLTLALAQANWMPRWKAAAHTGPAGRRSHHQGSSGHGNLRRVPSTKATWMSQLVGAPSLGQPVVLLARSSRGKRNRKWPPRWTCSATGTQPTQL